MAPSKTLLFLGRTDPDTGYDICRQLAQKLHWKLVVATGNIPDPEKLIEKSDVVFATGYLSILEAFIHRKPVIATYSNPLRRDYLLLHPRTKSIIIGQTSAEIAEKVIKQSPAKTAKILEAAYVWAKSQTWLTLAHQYEILWQTK